MENGAGAGLSSSGRPLEGADVLLRGAADEAGLTLDPPYRYRSLLVPVDGEPFGEHALPLALGIARRAGTEVRVVHVHCPVQSAYRPDRLYYDGGLDAWVRRRRQAYLDDLVRRLAKVTSVRVTPVYMEGREVAASLCAAASAGTDLVVMATRGRGPLGRFWFGSAADVLLRRLSVPLLLVRGSDAPADLTGDPLVRHVLIPLDGSPFAEQILEPGVTLGTLMGADHTLLQVLRPATDHSAGFGGSLEWPPRDQQHAEASAYLRRVVERRGGRTLRVHARTVRDERPTAQAILRYARTHDADLIALATRGRGGLARLFRGSVADRVVRGASVPVLVFRPDGQE